LLSEPARAMKSVLCLHPCTQAPLAVLNSGCRITTDRDPVVLDYDSASKSQDPRKDGPRSEP